MYIRKIWKNDEKRPTNYRKMHSSNIFFVPPKCKRTVKCGRCLNASKTTNEFNEHKNFKIDLNYSDSRIEDVGFFLAEIINLKSICSKRMCVFVYLTMVPFRLRLCFQRLFRLVMMRFVCLTYRRSWYKSVVYMLKSQCYDIQSIAYPKSNLKKTLSSLPCTILEGEREKTINSFASSLF